MTVPRGWVVIRQEPDATTGGPSEDDLMAIADAVREAGASRLENPEKLGSTPEIGRRGHLRAIPSN